MRKPAFACASSVAAQAGLCQTWLETPQTGFLASLLKCADVGINFRFTKSSVVQPFLLSVNGERMCTKHL